MTIDMPTDVYEPKRSVFPGFHEEFISDIETKITVIDYSALFYASESRHLKVVTGSCCLVQDGGSTMKDLPWRSSYTVPKGSDYYFLQTGGGSCEVVETKMLDSPLTV